jgi:hypothetical protein
LHDLLEALLYSRTIYDNHIAGVDLRVLRLATTDRLEIESGGLALPADGSEYGDRRAFASSVMPPASAPPRASGWSARLSEMPPPVYRLIDCDYGDS